MIVLVQVTCAQERCVLECACSESVFGGTPLWIWLSVNGLCSEPWLLPTLSPGCLSLKPLISLSSLISLASLLPTVSVGGTLLLGLGLSERRLIGGCFFCFLEAAEDVWGVRDRILWVIWGDWVGCDGRLDRAWEKIASWFSMDWHHCFGAKYTHKNTKIHFNWGSS